MPEVDYEGEVRSFEARVHALRAGARSCVERFRSTTDDNLLYLFAERLGGLGSLAIPVLYELVLDDPTATPSHRYLAAWVAVRLGDRGAAVEHLCAEVVSGSSYALPAANALTARGLVAGIEPMTTVLLQLDPDEVMAVFDWAMAIHDLGGGLPTAVRRELETRDAHWAAKAVLDAFPTSCTVDDRDR